MEARREQHRELLFVRAPREVRREPRAVRDAPRVRVDDDRAHHADVLVGLKHAEADDRLLHGLHDEAPVRGSDELLALQPQRLQVRHGHRQLVELEGMVATPHRRWPEMQVVRHLPGRACWLPRLHGWSRLWRCPRSPGAPRAVLLLTHIEQRLGDHIRREFTSTLNIGEPLGCFVVLWLLELVVHAGDGSLRLPGQARRAGRLARHEPRPASPGEHRERANRRTQRPARILRGVRHARSVPRTRQ